jgi:hypothetical protein
MKKQTIRGWVPKHTERIFEKYIVDGIDDCYRCEDVDIEIKKGKKEDWPLAQWPPKKIKIVVEAG